MKLKYIFFALVMGVAGAFGTSEEHALGIVEGAVRKTNPVASDHVAIEMVNFDGQKQQRVTRTHLGKAKSAEIVGLLEQDHEDNVRDIINFRWRFRKFANFTEAFGNGLLYLGSGLATIAGGVKMVGSDHVSNILLFASTVCFASHVTLIGCAKCSAREQKEREILLDRLADPVGFPVTSLYTPIVDYDDGKAPANNTAPTKAV